MVLFYRVIADFFWDYKFCSLILNLFVLFKVFKVLFVGDSSRMRTNKEVRKSYFVLFILFALLLASYMVEIDLDSSLIFSKILSSFLLFVLGVNASKVIPDSKKVALLCLVLIIVEFGFAVFKIGYQYWGDVYTFSGNYYFKTDLSLAITISLIYLLFFIEIAIVPKLLFVAICLYLIYISNARIHLLSSTLIITLYFLKDKILRNAKRVILIGLPAIFGGFSALAIGFSYFLEKAGLLTIDFFNFYTNENMQGRNVIWDTLIENYSKADLTEKALGMGLLADRKINALYAGTEDVNNAHNGYLFILIALGFVGLFLFLLFTVLVFKRFFFLCKTDKSKDQAVLLMVFLSHAVIFYVANFSNANILFQQQTWFFMFFSGIIFNKKYFGSSKKILLVKSAKIILSEKAYRRPLV